MYYIQEVILRTNQVLTGEKNLSVFFLIISSRGELARNFGFADIRHKVSERKKKKRNAFCVFYFFHTKKKTSYSTTIQRLGICVEKIVCYTCF